MLVRSRSGLLLGSALLLLASCSSDHFDATVRGSVPPLPTAAGDSGVRAFVAHRDLRSSTKGTPSFTWLAKTEGTHFASAIDAGTAALRTLKSTLSLDDAAFASLSNATIDASSLGPIVARYEQRDARGIEVFRGGLTIALTRSFDPVSASGLVAPTLHGADRPFTRSSQQALADAFANLNLGALSPTSLGPSDGGYEKLSAPGLRAPARVKKVLFPVGTGVVPAYYVEVQVTRGPSMGYVVSASDGRTLFTADLVHNEKVTYRVYGDATTMIPSDGPQGNAASPSASGVPDDFKPSLGPSTLITLQNFPFSKNDPWLADGATVTSGNNVNAYPDLEAPDGIGGDANASVTDTATFDYTYDYTKSPDATPANLAASATQLFYLTNFLHDWYYDVGFDEASGNHQQNNFGRGGIGGDPLLAEGQDYSGTDNANATVLPDGMSPRLQMYQWTGASVSSVTVETPASIAGVKASNTGATNAGAFDLTAPVVMGEDDAGTDVFDACETLSVSLTGKIALIHRGTCSFVQKVQNAQAAGAAGVLITNVPTSADPNHPPFMGGAPEGSTPITIPALSLAVKDGQALEAALAGGATVHMHREAAVNLDGSIDTTVPAHEWGHVLSNRLVSDALGLTTNQSGGLGEGWADFSAMMLMVRADDIQSPGGADWKGGYVIGGYVGTGTGAPFYFGIRRVPYSIDFAKDPLTFKDIANGTPLPSGAPIAYGEDGSFNSEVHSTGEIWTTMLWECYASLLKDGRYTFLEAQERMKRYLVASLKLTPADPTLLEARDAVLSAALATDAKDYTLFWEAFARRGAGAGATGPGKDSTDNTGVVESYSADNDVQITGGTVTDNVAWCDHDGFLDDGEIGEISFDVRNAGPGALTAPVATLSAGIQGVEFPAGPSVPFMAMAPLTTQTVKIKIQVQVKGLEKQTAVPLTVTVTDPTFAKGHTSHYTTTVRAQVDEAEASSATDNVDTTMTAWSTQMDDADGNAAPWGRAFEGLGGYWSAPDPFDAAELKLVSPPFTLPADKTTFELAFKHRYSFRISTRRMVDVDGGVVEVSTDNGRTWVDVSTLGTADYNTTIDTGGRADNLLGGRKAYGNTSKGYPDTWLETHLKLDLGTHPDSVRVRFHTGSASGFAPFPGWDIDDVQLIGTEDKPFWSFVDHADQCDPAAPTVNAGPSITVAPGAKFSLDGSGSSPAGLPLEFVWAQLDGPVALPFPSTPGSAHLDLLAPSGTQTMTLSFELRANDGMLVSPGSRVTVTVAPPGGGDDGCTTSRRTPGFAATGSVAAAGAASLAMLAALLLRRRRTS